MNIASARLFGDGVAFDAGNGRIRIPAPALQAGLTFVAGGALPFRLTVAAAALAAPAMVDPPRLMGTGTIGTAISVDPGLWSGMPAPDVTFAWQRDGVAIPEMTGPSYLPLAADDRAGLNCRVTATNLVGSAAAETVRLAVAWPAPLVVAELPDQAFTAAAGLQAVATAFAFAGASLDYGVAAAGVTIDPTTGILSIDTALARETVVMVTARNSGGTVERSFALRVTGVAGFTIPARLWSAVHDLERGLGQRRIEIDATVVVPDGHLLKLYSNTTPGGTATARSATLTPGVLFQSSGPLALGATCYNSIWLLRESDGAILAASENEISFVIKETGTVTPPPEVDPEDFPAADISPTTMSVVMSTLTAWKGNWAGTVPAGKNASDPRYIDMPSGFHGTLSLKSYGFPQPVYLRSADKVTLGALFDRVVIDTCQNVHFEFVRVERDTFLAAADAAVDVMDSVNCSFSYGTTIGPAELSAVEYGKRFGVAFKFCTDCAYRHNLLTDWVVGITIAGGSNFKFEDNVLDNMKGDDTKIGGGKDIYFTRNWCSLTKRLYAPGDHTDFCQDQSDVSNVHNNTYLRDGFYCDGHIMYQKVDLFRSFQGMFFGGYGIRKNIKIHNSILLCNNGNVKWKAGTLTGDASNGVTNCNGLYPAPAKPEGLAQGNGTLMNIGGSNANNIVTRLGTKDEGAGAGGIHINCGAGLSDQHYENQHAYFIGPVQSAASTNSPIKELMPVEGSQAHWDHADPKGAYARLKDIAVNGNHPGNSPNPILAAYWQSTWNWDGHVTA